MLWTLVRPDKRRLVCLLSYSVSQPYSRVELEFNPEKIAAQGILTSKFSREPEESDKPKYTKIQPRLGPKTP